MHGAAARRMTVLCVLLALVVPVRCLLPEPYASLYHSTDSILGEFAALAQRHPDLLSWSPASEATGSLRLGVATFGLRGSDPQAQAAFQARPRLLLVFGEHAREVITSDTALWLARVLVDETSELEAWPEAVAASAATRRQHADSVGLSLSAWARALLAQVTLVVVPVEVPSSRRAVESGQLCRRKTMAEVDLNRNWATAWRADAGRGEDEYGGAQPFSEPQSQALRQLAQQLLPTAYANVHSGEWAVYVPWDHKRALALGLPTDTPQLLEQLNTHCKCTRGAGGAASNYLAYGTSMDWMWQELHVPYSLTFELYGSNEEGHRPDSWSLPATAVEGLTEASNAAAGRRLTASSALSCLSMFNPDSAGSYRAVVAGWVQNFLLLAEHVALHPQPSAQGAPPLPVATSPPAGVATPRKVLRPGVGGGGAVAPLAVFGVVATAALAFCVLRRRARVQPGWLGGGAEAARRSV